MSAAPITIQKTCAALHKYYESVGKGHMYLDEDGVGRLTAWCDVNGIDDNAFRDQLAKDSAQCSLVDFDEEFPFKEKHKLTEQDIRDLIHEILKECSQGHDFTSPIRIVNQKDFDQVSESQVENMKKIYKQHCPILFRPEFASDANLLQMVAFQHFHKIDDYLANLVDVFTRYRIKHNSLATVSEWTHLPQNHHFHKGKLQNVQVKVVGIEKPIKYVDFATECIKSFNTQICPPLNVAASRIRIDDEIETLANYMDAAIAFVSSLARSKLVPICPFQVDVAIAVGAPKVMNTVEEEKENQDPNDLVDAKYEDYVQDIQAKLTANKLKFTKSSFLQFEKKGKGAQRIFDPLFRQFIHEHDIPMIGDEGMHYLKNRRLMALVDRRISKKSDNDDAIFMYEPPAGAYTRDIPDGDEFVNEWFFSASKTCLLPNAGYDAEKVIKGDVDKKPGCNIGSGDHCAAGLVTLSFHVYSADKIKLYFYWRGQGIRFLPRDVRVVLPRLFVESDSNAKYVKDEDGSLAQMVERMRKSLVDEQFAASRKQFEFTMDQNKK